MSYSRTRSSKTPYSSFGDLYSFVTKDNPTPNYKALVASGVLLCKDYQNTTIQVAGPQGSSISTGYHCGREKVVIGVVDVGVARQWLDTSTQWNLANASALMDIARRKVGMDPVSDSRSGDWAVAHTSLSADLNTGIASVLVSAAELPKTVKMINEALRLLRNPLINAKNKLRLTRAQIRTPEGRKAMLEMAEQDWLEGRYGWRPFIYDVMSWVDAGKSKYAERRTVKTAVKKVAPDPKTFIIEQQRATGLPYVSKSATWTVNYIASAGQTADFGVNLSQFARTWGALDLVGTAWELVKFSFVLDWFLNLGDSLKALQVYALIDERIGWNKIQYEGRVVTTYTYPAIGSYPDMYWIDKLVNVQREPTIERVRATTRTAVTSFLPHLGFKFDVDSAKTLDLLALLHQLVRGR